MSDAAATAELRLDRDVWITMQDGVRLAADVYRPGTAGRTEPAPTILVRSTYDKADPEPDIEPERFVAHGYAVVIQDVRGRYASEGEFYHGSNEVADGYDTLNWIAAQPWSNGKIGMTGISYLAAVQTAAACSGNEHLSSLMHIFAPADYYKCGHRQRGNAALYMVPITFMFAATSKEAQNDPVLRATCEEAFANSVAWLARLPLKRGLNPLSRAPKIEDWLLDIMTHPDYGDFWTNVVLWQPCEYVDQHADIPGYFVGGWYDMYREEEFYELLAPTKRGPIRLLIGPWTHLNFHVPSGSSAGDVEFGPDAAFGSDELFALQLEWFDATLKGAPPQRDAQPVRIFVMGGGDGHRTPEGKLYHGGHWRGESEWPLERRRETAYFLHADGTLRTKAPEAARPTSYVSDPRDPVPTVGGVHYFLRPNWKLYVPYGPQDQREQEGLAFSHTNLPLSSRHDLITFQTTALTADLEVTGTPRVILWVSSSARDTDFIGRLIDVYPPNADYPDGYAMNLSEGILRMRYRESFRTPTLIVPEQIYRIEIDLYATSNLFQRGHRLRVDIASSSFPAYDVNSNTGGPLLDARESPLVAINSVYHDREHQSQLVLPVIPAAC
jgi:putative CocE/NonD family hydrolase